MEKKRKPKIYTVVAVYADNFQRYATLVKATGADEAEREAQRACRERLKWKEEDGDPLIIAAVIEGKVKIVA